MPERTRPNICKIHPTQGSHIARSLHGLLIECQLVTNERDSPAMMAPPESKTSTLRLGNRGAGVLMFSGDIDE
jgi:hypothetical protein